MERLSFWLLDHQWRHWPIMYDDVFFVVSQNELLNKELSCQWFEMLGHLNDEMRSNLKGCWNWQVSQLFVWSSVEALKSAKSHPHGKVLVQMWVFWSKSSQIPPCTLFEPFQLRETTLYNVALSEPTLHKHRTWTSSFSPCPPSPGP